MTSKLIEHEYGEYNSSGHRIGIWKCVDGLNRIRKKTFYNKSGSNENHNIVCEKYYFGNGNIHKICEYDGIFSTKRRHGTWYRYYDDGCCAFEGEWFYGAKHGLWKYLMDNRKTMLVYKYLHGVQIQKPFVIKFTEPIVIDC